MRKDGTKVQRADFKWRCGTCLTSVEPGWLWLGGKDHVQCPNCVGGFITGIETRVEPTRKIFLAKAV